MHRIHQEDFAQVLDVYGADDGKYQHATFDKIAFLVQRICPDDRAEFLRRLVFMVLSGNADMHLKNWSLRYPDGIRPRLSPAYDQLTTVIYADIDQRMAFKLGRSRRFEDVRLDSFDRLEGPLEMSVAVIKLVVEATVQDALAAWVSLSDEIPLEPEYRRWMQQRLDSLPLACG